MAVDGSAPRVRLPRLTLVAVGFTLAALVLVVAALWLSWDPGDPTRAARVPVATRERFPRNVFLVAVSLFIAGQVVALSAAHLRVGIQVLRRDRRIPPHLPHAVRVARTRMLAPRGEGERSRDVLPAVLPDPRTVTPVRLTVLVPAHNEELVIGAALQSLSGQSRPPDRTVVITDNCTDGTAEIARSLGAEVVPTVGNEEKKAGALNQVLARLLPEMGPADVVMVMDADTILVDGFLEVAVGRLHADPELMAVGGVFVGEEGGGLVGQFQRNEYTRYARTIGRRQGKVFVLTGTASLIRAHALSAVAGARGRLLPGPEGQVYDTWALTEDNELTLALKTLGARMVSPQECRCVT